MKTPPTAATAEQPTFEHSLAAYLTRNGRVGNTAKVQYEIERFMYDRK
jgi:hypothetical protein